MARTVTAKLTSEERCRKAFGEWYARERYEAVQARSEGTPILVELNQLVAFDAWQACWQYLQTTVTKEFIES